MQYPLIHPFLGVLGHLEVAQVREAFHKVGPVHLCHFIKRLWVRELYLTTRQLKGRPEPPFLMIRITGRFKVAIFELLNPYRRVLGHRQLIIADIHWHPTI